MAGVSLATVAQLQLQNGTWKLSTLAVGMATTKRDLEAKCPIPLTSSATMATVWATVIGITVLKQVEPPSPPSPHSSPLPLPHPSLFTTIPIPPLTLHHHPHPSISVQVRGYELSVRRGQKWLKTCSFPDSVALDNLYSAAEQLL